MRTTWILGLVAFALAPAAGCGGRPAVWDEPASNPKLQALQNALAVVDDPAHRVVLLRAGVDQTLTTTSVGVGSQVIATAASADGKRLFVLSAGSGVAGQAGAEPASLSVIDVGAPQNAVRYDLSEVRTKIAVDPGGSRVVLYGSDPSAGSFIENPNEILIVDLDRAPGLSNPYVPELPSRLAASPARVTFAPGVQIPGTDPRELLVVETDKDLRLLDLDHPDHPWTLPITDTLTQSTVLAPAGVVVDPGAPGRLPTIAVRASSDDDVFLFQLKPSDDPAAGSDFRSDVNTVAVGGVPSDFAFVNTNQGVRLAVVVPGAALLIDPADNRFATTSLGMNYASLSVAPIPGADPPADEAILFRTVTMSGAGSSSAVAVWNLSEVPSPGTATLNAPEGVTLDSNVRSVLDVPGAPLKVLETVGNVVYVFDLERRTPSPLDTRTNVHVRVAPQDERAWAFVSGAPQLAQIDLAGPHPREVVVDGPVDDVLELGRAGLTNALLVLHTSSGGLGVTVYDAVTADPNTSKRYSNLLLEGLVP